MTTRLWTITIGEGLVAWSLFYFALFLITGHLGFRDWRELLLGAVFLFARLSMGAKTKLLDRQTR